MLYSWFLQWPDAVTQLRPLIWKTSTWWDSSKVLHFTPSQAIQSNLVEVGKSNQGSLSLSLPHESLM
jgi:hypothetical protein